jgi:DNA modification methylase
MQRVPIGTIKNNPNNPRVIKDDKFKKLVQSIKDLPEMAEVRPVVVNTDMVVLGGNMRLKAMREAGWKDVPIHVVDWDEDKQRQFIIKDNVSGGEWDWDMLANEWDTKELQEWGLDLPDFNNAKELEAEEDDYEMPDQVQTDIVLGDLFEIGPHRLLCGDSTDSDAVAKLMDGQKADMAHNDPPYGMKKENEGVLNDNLNYDDLLDFNRGWISLQFTHLKENGSWYCWGIDEPLMDIYSGILKPYFKQNKATFRNLITWDKGNGQGQNCEETRSYATADEKCLFVMLGVQGFNTNADNYFEGWEPIRLHLDGERKNSGFTTNECNKICGKTNMTQHAFTKGGFRLILREDYEKLKQASNGNAFKREYDDIKREYDDIKKNYYLTRAYFNNTHDNMNSVWHFARHNKNGSEGGHATPKPILLCERAIKSSSTDGGLVLDLFLGSGSTMVASHQLNRKCYGMELEPKYCQVIVDRMLKLDPTLDVKRNGLPYKTAD